MPSLVSSRRVKVALLVTGVLTVVAGGTALAAIIPDQTFSDPTGLAQDFTPNGTVDNSNPFFVSLGSNGRTCATCHVASQGWALNPAFAQSQLRSKGITNPLFNNVDGTDCPGVHPQSIAEQQADSTMLLGRALIRFSMTPPSSAEFTVVSAQSSFACSINLPQLTIFRLIPPSTNRFFDTAVMADGREDVQAITTDTSQPGSNLAGLTADLESQAKDAILGHEQATSSPSTTTLQQIVSFEEGLTTAQIKDNQAGSLEEDANGHGGPKDLAGQSFHIGINAFGSSGFTPEASTLYPQLGALSPATPTPAQASITRGEKIFNERTFQVTGVAGFNNPANLNQPITATCTSCHDTPNVFDSSSTQFMNIGTASTNSAVPGLNLLKTSNLPLYVLINKSTGQSLETTDPGRALVTGKWADIGAFKVPILRDLSQRRGPFFHNGSAPDLQTVIAFFNARFNIGLSTQDRADLLAYLRSL